MTSFFEKLARGVEAAQAAMGKEVLAETHAFDLRHAALFPLAKLRRTKSDGEMVVTLELSDARTTMTLGEFGRFVDELAAFRQHLDKTLP